MTVLLFIHILFLTADDSFAASNAVAKRAVKLLSITLL